MIEAMVKEIALQSAYLSGQSIDTIYFGGGTPSLLPKAMLSSILAQIQGTFDVSGTAEITLEANPDDISERYLEDIASVGVNRLSIGVQSFNPEVLKWMNRAHDQKQARACLAMVRKMGFENFSMDLIFGVPHKHYDLEKDLLATLEELPPHISTYNLTIEPSTVLGHRQSKGLLREVSEEDAAAQYEFLIEQLVNQGYHHYEISNFATPGNESKHNSAYWRQQHYLGIGPSAHSFDGKSRQFNVANNAKYLQSISQNLVPFQKEVLSQSQKINEMIMTGLRTSNGLDLAKLEVSYNFDLVNKNTDYLQQLTQEEFAVIEEKLLILTTRGKLIADRIASDLFITDD